MVLWVRVEKGKRIKILLLVSVGLGKVEKREKIKIGKGLKVEIF